LLGRSALGRSERVGGGHNDHRELMDNYLDMRFPVAGIDLTRAFSDQQPRPLPQGQWDPTGSIAVVPGVGAEPQPADVYGRTCVSAVNVRGFEASQQRRRGGTRPGLTKWIATSVGGFDGWLVQHLNQISTTGIPVQPNQMGRVVWLVPVSQGRVFYARAGDSNWTEANNAVGNTPPLSFTGVVRSATNGQRMWFADGTNWVYFDPGSGTVYPWVASAGPLPVDSANNKPRLIANWRGRIVLAGLFDSPQAVFFSRVDDPTDWDFSATLENGDYDPAGAFATTLGPQNSPGAPVTALIPFNDDVMVIGTSDELWMVNGDPQAGGQISLLTNAIGIAWGEAFCQMPDGTIIFVSNKMGVYMMQPGQLPQRFSQSVDQLLDGVDTGSNSIRLAWDDRFQGLHIFITPLDEPKPTIHYFWEARTGAWVQEVFANDDHNPIAICVFDGNTTSDRSVLMGGWDGFVRYIDPTAIDDDGTPIESEVWLGPILSKTFDEVKIKEMVVDLGETSGEVNFDVFPGITAEAALSADSAASGTLSASRNDSQPIHVADHAMYVRLSSTVPWAMERMRLTLAEKGVLTGRRK
jgi:hypothetical protein